MVAVVKQGLEMDGSADFIMIIACQLLLVLHNPQTMLLIGPTATAHPATLTFGFIFRAKPMIRTLCSGRNFLAPIIGIIIGFEVVSVSSLRCLFWGEEP